MSCSLRRGPLLPQFRSAFDKFLGRWLQDGAFAIIRSCPPIGVGRVEELFFGTVCFVPRRVFVEQGGARARCRPRQGDVAEGLGEDNGGTGRRGNTGHHRMHPFG